MTTETYNTLDTILTFAVILFFWIMIEKENKENEQQNNIPNLPAGTPPQDDYGDFDGAIEDTRP